MTCFLPRFRLTSGRLLALFLALFLPGALDSNGAGDGLAFGQAITKKILLVTGEDYPGHKWKETAPVLARAIQADPRLKVEIAWQTTALRDVDLSDYDAVVMHFKNYDPNVPGTEAQQKLEQFVRNGGGLILVHFACGAFQEWKDFVKLAGRVWDPKLRAHDPRGEFMVHIVDHEHPITKGMKDFLTNDELYTCLAGNVPIRVLAAARSKVDGKDYPMAFVLQYGKGRVFHCPLGHDVRALSVPEVQTLFRRAAAWVVGLNPDTSGS